MKSQVVRWVSRASAVAALSALASAQYSEGFESYTVGAAIDGLGGWAQWDLTAVNDAYVSNLFAHSGSNSLATELDADKVQDWNTTYSSGQWRLGTWVYVPSTLIDPQWFVMLSDYAPGCAGASTCYWVAQASVDPTVPEFLAQVGPSMCTGLNQYALTTPLTFDTWHHIEVDVKLGTCPVPTAQLYWDGAPLGDPFNYSQGLMGTGSVGNAQIDTLDLYANNNLTAFDRVYWDDVSITASTASFTPCYGAVELYCTAGTTTTGCIPALTATGTPSASATSGFLINLVSAETNKLGLFFYGVTDMCYTPVTWGVGGSTYLCVKAPTQRLTSQQSGGTTACTGFYSTDWSVFMANNPGALGNPIAAGQAFSGQYWFRDPPAVKTTNLSSAVRWVMAP